MAAKIAPCPNCNSNQLYQSEPVSAGGGHAPNYLPGLGSFFRAEQFQLVVCRDCGLTRFFARPEALAKLGESGKWHRI
jgi:predicted nucleic-acid-binding Zn-ribbon protein